MKNEKILEAIKKVIDEEAGPEIPVEELRAYCEGSLTEEQEEDMRERLANTPQSTALLKEMMRFGDDPETEAPVISDQELSEDWLSFQAKLEEESQASHLGFQEKRPSLFRIAIFSSGIAAGLIMAMLFSKFSSPGENDVSISANTHFVDLFPRDPSRGESQNREIAAPQGFERVMFILTPPDDLEYESFQAVLYEGNQESLKMENLLMTSEETFNLTIPLEVAKKTTLLKLLGTREGESRVICEYAIDFGGRP